MHNKWDKLLGMSDMEISKIKPKELPRVRPGMVSILEVSLNGIIIGTGYSFWTVEEGMTDVVLINLDGTNMEPGWYDLKIINGQLGIKSERIH